MGFHFGNTSNFVGLTTNYQSHDANLIVNGLAFFKSTPTNQTVVDRLTQAKNYFQSQIGSFEGVDKNEDSFLIYYFNEDAKSLDCKIFDLKVGTFLESQPKLVLLDDSKIYNHSALVELSLAIKLDVMGGENTLADRDKIDKSLMKVKENFMPDGTSLANLRLHQVDGSYSTNFNQAIKNLKNSTESLYDHLDVPKDVEQMGDYLPQMTNEDKKKLVDKWKNKVKNQRASLKFKMEHDSLSYDNDDDLIEGFYGFRISLYLHLHVNDSISKSCKRILFAIRKQLEIVGSILTKKTNNSIESQELACCTFKIRQLGHLVSTIYSIPKNIEPSYEFLKQQRNELHDGYLLPKCQPQLRYSQRMLDLGVSNIDEKLGYLCNVHETIVDSSGVKGGLRNVIKGTYTYHHYMQNRCQDNGWGCAYRSLQTIISHYKHQGFIYSPDVEVRALNKDKKDDKINLLRLKLHKESRVPTHEEIQSVLVDVGDKQPSFIGSQKWIGSQEVCFVLSHLYNLDSKFINVSSGSELVYKARELGSHFESQSTPVMIGGGVLAHTIIGIDFNDKNGDVGYLILDPHYTGEEDISIILKKGWCGWKKNAFWDKNAFYNLCLPQKPNEY